MLKFILIGILISSLFNNWGVLISSLFLIVFLFGVIAEGFGIGVVNFIFIDVLSYFLSYLSIWILILMLVISFYIKEHKVFPSIFFRVRVSYADFSFN